MKSRARKTGGAFRRKQQMMSLHTKKGKDRSKQKGQKNEQSNKTDC